MGPMFHVSVLGLALLHGGDDRMRVEGGEGFFGWCGNGVGGEDLLG